MFFFKSRYINQCNSVFQISFIASIPLHCSSSSFLPPVMRMESHLRGIYPSAPPHPTPPPHLQRRRQFAIMGYENFPRNSASSKTSWGCVIAALTIFLALTKRG